MSPVDFPTANQTFGKPENMEDEECLPLRAEVGIDNDGYPYVVTAWMPNVDDMKALNRGEPIYLKTIGGGLAPTSMFTLDQEGKGNWD